ncbi:MAG: hypothetical protein GWN00_09205, partial [Aliifodinibius sp.]|nr:sulfotransferase [Fodinibius sp.]NIV11340.1 hypothetical protein [Fodinibius sp.]NIY24973.1 hypothetical protein [Fodinibius sp.]
HYNEANNLHRQHISYNASSNEKYINSIIKTFREDFFIRHNIPRDKTTPCLFIVGMPRSGTTLTERILSMHPRIAGKGESTVLDETINQTLNKKNLPPYPAGMEKLSTSDLASIGKQYIDAIREKTEPGIMTADKMPHNFLHIGLIKTVIPDAKIIHCTRD